MARKNKAYYLSYLDFNECLDLPCHIKGVCTNTVGSYQCTCRVGYNGNGIICEGMHMT